MSRFSLIYKAMKTKLIFSLCVLIFFSFGFKLKMEVFQSEKIKRPVIYIDNFKTEVKEGVYVNCRKVSDMSVVVYLNKEMQGIDLIKIELHRFGKDENIIAGSKIFIPSSKEFIKKYADKDSVKLKILTKEDDFNGSDFEVNTTVYPRNIYLNNAFCDFHDLKHCSFYIVTMAYTKTGEKNEFGEELYTSGKEISERSVIFKNWEDKTVK